VSAIPASLAAIPASPSSKLSFVAQPTAEPVEQPALRLLESRLIVVMDLQPHGPRVPRRTDKVVPNGRRGGGLPETTVEYGLTSAWRTQFAAEPGCHLQCPEQRKLSSVAQPSARHTIGAGQRSSFRLGRHTATQVLSCSTFDRPELSPRLFGRDLQFVDLAAVLLGELDEFVLGSLRAPAAFALYAVLHALTSSRAGY